MPVVESHNLSVLKKKGTLPRVPFLSIKEKILGKKYELSIVFVTPKEAQTININHRGKDYTPNTLAFPLSKTSGEIIMCEQIMRTQFKDFKMDYPTYLIFMTIHSMLHLKGYVHGGTMERKEKQFLKLFT